MRSLAILLFFAAAGAGAQTVQQPAPTNGVATKSADMSDIVCERQKVPGSRLGTAKVCKTRAEWADLKSQDRMEVERAQTQRGMAPQ